MSDRVYVSPESDEVLVVPGGVEIISVGTQGPPGAGGASGGTTGQYLRKASNTDFDTTWDTLDAADLPSHTHSASDIIAGQLGLARGGTGADLSATGGSGQVVKQTSAGGVFTVAALLEAEIPTLSIAKTSGLQAALDAKQALDSDLTTIAGLTPSNDDTLQYIGGNWANRTPAQARTTLGLGTIATQAADNVNLTGGSISGLTSFANNGNTTLGNDSADTLTINGTAVSIPNGLNIDSNTLVIDATNNRIAIGTTSFTSAATKLQVAGRIDTSGPLIRVTNTAAVEMGADGTSGYFGTDNGFPLYLRVASSTRGLIDTSGNFLLGASSGTANAKLQVVGDVSVGDANALYLGAPTVNGSWRIIRNSNDFDVALRVLGSYVSKFKVLATPPTYTQTYSTADRTFSAYTSDTESSAYTGIDNAQGGTPYAQLTSLNQLRTAYENLRVFTEDLAALVNSMIDDLQTNLLFA